MRGGVWVLITAFREKDMKKLKSTKNLAKDTETRPQQIKGLTTQQALQNIDIIVSNSRLTRQEHAALIESVNLIRIKCNRADELEKHIKEKEECPSQHQH